MVHALPIATTIRRGGGASPAAICSASSYAPASAPNVPTVVAPPGGITIDERSRRAIASPRNGTSTTERSRTIGQPLAINAPQFSIAHGDAGCGNRIAPASSPAARAWITVAITWFEPYAPIAQIRFAPRSRA